MIKTIIEIIVLMVCVAALGAMVHPFPFFKNQPEIPDIYSTVSNRDI